MELFGTAGIRGDATSRVTPELALAVGRAAGLDGDEFVLGRDGRETGQALGDAAAAGLASAGARVVRLGQVPTPALAYASRGRRGLMVTASHNPPSDNGLKLFEDGEEYHRTAERAVEDRVAAGRDGAGVPAGPDPVAWDRWGDAEHAEVLSDYRDAVAAYAARVGDSLEGLGVVVDCGNGMGAVATPQVLRALGADVVALNANVDGHFPGRASKPTPESLSDLRRFLRDGSDGQVFDLGVAHDGDADRVVFLDGEGVVIHEDTVLAILAERFVYDSDAADPVVVTTPNASARVDDRVRAAGGRVERVRLGALHEGIRSAREDGDEGTEVVFAGEPWKHVHVEFGPWIDGIASAAVFCRLAATDGVAGLCEPVTERPYRKVSIPCPDDLKVTAMRELEDALPDAFPEARVSTDHGIRLEFPDSSWLLVRPSGTETYVRLYAESDDVDELVTRARSVVERAVDE